MRFDQQTKQWVDDARVTYWLFATEQGSKVPDSVGRVARTPGLMGDPWIVPVRMTPAEYTALFDGTYPVGSDIPAYLMTDEQLFEEFAGMVPTR